MSEWTEDGKMGIEDEGQKRRGVEERSVLDGDSGSARVGGLGRRGVRMSRLVGWWDMGCCMGTASWEGRVEHEAASDE